MVKTPPNFHPAIEHNDKSPPLGTPSKNQTRLETDRNAEFIKPDIST